MLMKMRAVVQPFRSLATILSAPLIILLLLLCGSSISLAHGGEDHGDEKAAVAPKGRMNVKLAATDALEILLKYPTPKPGEEVALRVFITNIKTNAPVEGITAILTVRREGKTEAENGASSSGAVVADAIKATATDTPGVYEAPITFPDADQYAIALQLAGAGVNEKVTIKGIEVPDAAASAAQKNSSAIPTFLLAMVAVLVSIAAVTYFFWVRPLMPQPADALAISQYPGAQERQA